MSTPWFDTRKNPESRQAFWISMATLTLVSSSEPKRGEMSIVGTLAVGAVFMTEKVVSLRDVKIVTDRRFRHNKLDSLVAIFYN